MSAVDRGALPEEPLATQGQQARSLVLQAAEVLWPAPAVVRERGRRTTPPANWHVAEEYLVLPMRPMLLPTGRLTGAGIMLAKARAKLPLHERLLRIGLAGAVAAGVPRLVWRARCSVEAPDDAPEQHAGILANLNALFGQPVSIGLAVGSRRVNQKPVLVIVDRRGRLLGFGKLALNPLTQQLARNEHTALTTLAAHSIPGVRVPHILSYGPFGAGDLLVLAALHTSMFGRPLPLERVLQAMVAVASVEGIEALPVAASRWWAFVEDRLGQLGDSSVADRLRSVADTFLERHGGDIVSFGWWHGDWTRWNVGTSKGQVMLWDFERSTDCAPVGLDAVHLILNRAFEGGGGCLLEAVARLQPAAQEVVRGLGAQTAPGETVFQAYLIELAVRGLVSAAINPTPWGAARTEVLVQAGERSRV